MIIIYHGQDTFRSRVALREIGFDYLRLDAREISFSDFKQAVETASMFNEKRFVVVEGLSEAGELQRELEQYQNLNQLGSRQDVIVLFYERKKISQEKAFHQLRARAKEIKEFSQLSGTEAEQWWERFLQKHKIAFHPKALRALLAQCDNSWQVYTEAQKLNAYRDGRIIREEDVINLGPQRTEAQIFVTLDALFSGDKDRGFYYLQNHWQAGEHPEQFFALFARQVRIISLLKKGRASELDLHPFVVKKTLPLAGRYSWPKIKRLWAQMMRFDAQIKRGALDSYLGVELLCANLAN